MPEAEANLGRAARARAIVAPARPEAGAARALRQRIVLAAALAVAACSAPPTPTSWVVYYGQDAPAEALYGYGVAVVDDGWRGSVAALHQGRVPVLAYLSLGEINRQRATFDAARAAGLLVAENANWPGSWMIDIRNPRWHDMVCDEIAPAIAARGFDGLFLDTIDSPLHLEHTRPAQFKGARAAAIALLHRLHARHPALKLMLNGGVELWASLGGAVDWVAIESTATTWEFASRTARWRTPAEQSAIAHPIALARAARPELVVFTLDYWDPADTDGQRAIYRVQRGRGFVPYVAMTALDRVVPEPPSDATPTSVPAGFGGRP